MTEHTYSPNYLSLYDYYKSLGADPMAARNTDAWTSTFYSLQMIQDRRIIGWMSVISEQWGSWEALDDFLYQFFYSKPVGGPGKNRHESMKFMLVQDAYYFRMQAESWINLILLDDEGDRRHYADDLTDADRAVLDLFAVCFNHAKADGLVSWLRADSGFDFFRIAELMASGVPSDVIPSVIASDVDGIDAGLLGAMFAG
jgi:hypothetical protein